MGDKIKMKSSFSPKILIFHHHVLFAIKE